jgi:hypothetical protein
MIEKNKTSKSNTDQSIQHERERRGEEEEKKNRSISYTLQ